MQFIALLLVAHAFGGRLVADISNFFLRCRQEKMRSLDLQ
jgi:hypothetical protein